MAAVFAISVVAVPVPDDLIPVLQRQEVRDEHGQFAFAFSTANGIAQTSHGALKANSDRTGNVLAQKV